MILLGVRSLPDVCPPPVPQPSGPPSRIIPGSSADHHVCSQHHQVVGEIRVPSDQTDSFRHGSPLPLKRQRHAPQELYTVPDWNSFPRQMACLPGTTQSTASGTSLVNRLPVPTSPHSRHLVLEELQIIAGTISHQPRLTRKSARAASGARNQWQNEYSCLIGARIRMPIIRDTTSLVFTQTSQLGHPLPI